MADLIQPEWRCFLETARHGSISKAAERLSLPQPSVTKYVRRLEESLGAKLFERSNRGVKLSQAGSRVLESLRGVESAFQERLRVALERQGEVSGTVLFGTHRVLAMGHLPEPLARLYRRHPGLRLELTLATSLEVTRLVALGKLDYGLVANPKRLPGLVIRPVVREKVAVYSKSAKVERIFYNPEMQLVRKALQAMGRTPSEAVPDYEVAAKLASAIPGAGALLPEQVAERHGLTRQASADLVFATVSLVYRAAIERSARHRAVVAAFERGKA